MKEEKSAVSLVRFGLQRRRVLQPESTICTVHDAGTSILVLMVGCRSIVSFIFLPFKGQSRKP